MRFQSVETTVYVSGFSQSTGRPRGESYLVSLDGIAVTTAFVNEWHMNGRSGKRTFALVGGDAVAIERAVKTLPEGKLSFTSDTGNGVELSKATARRETRLQFENAGHVFESGRRYRLSRDGVEVLVYVPDSTEAVHEAIQLDDTVLNIEQVKDEWSVQEVVPESSGQ